MTEEMLRKLFPRASASTIRRNLNDNAAGIPAGESQRAEQRPLDVPAPGKKARRARPVQCSEKYSIVFHIYAVRPFDWDNNSTKELQDFIVRSGILPSDDWRVLRGSVIPYKVEKPEEEKTIVEITRLL